MSGSVEREGAVGRERAWAEGGEEYLPASSVRAFLHPSCPSFGCFHGRHLVGSFTPGRRAAAGARTRREEKKREKEGLTPRGTDGGGLVETR